MTELLKAIVNHSFTVAVLTGLVSIIVVKMQKNNKKQEIDYLNEAEIKKEVRKHATAIVTSANEIAVGVNTYIDLIMKFEEIRSGNQSDLTKSKEEALLYIENNKIEKLEQVNKNAIKIIENLVQFELYFSDSRDEHKAVRKPNELVDLVGELKETIFNIQEEFRPLILFKEVKKSEKITSKLNVLISEFSFETRKSLRLYTYRLHGKPRLADWIEYIKPGFMKYLIIRKNKLPIVFSSLFIGMLCGLALGIVAWGIVAIIAGKYLSILSSAIILVMIFIRKLKSSNR
ncbi:hypothetical protein [Enterococcus aquimarinus]